MPSRRRRDDDAPPPKDPAQAYDIVKIYPTPEKQDLLFYVVRSDPPKSRAWAYKDPFWDAVTYPDHKLLHVTEQDAEGKSRWYYGSDRISEDAYNWEHVQVGIGDGKFEGVRRTYLVARDDYSATSPAAGAAMPDTPEDLFTGFILSGRRQQRTGDDIFDGVYVLEVRDYVKRIVTTQIGVDSLNGKPLYATETLYYSTETVGATGLTAAALFADTDNTYWGLQSDGTQRTGRQLNAHWYVVTVEQVVAGTAVGGVITIDTFTTNDDYYWPPVLAELEFMDWQRRDGGVDIYPRFEFEPDAYRGPCKTTVVRSWSKDGQDIPKVEPMQPTPIVYVSPFFRLAIPSCLHWDVECYCDIGTEDPIYSQNVGSTRVTVATNHVTWPSEIVGYDDQVPYRGGYLRIRKTHESPDEE